MKKIAILFTIFLLLTSVVMAEKLVEDTHYLHDEYDEARGCSKGEHWVASKETCESICKPAYDYDSAKNKCVGKCHWDEGMTWDYAKQECIDICSTNPTHHFCKDGKFESLDYDQYAEKGGLAGKIKDKFVDRSVGDDETEECASGERLIAGECMSKCDYYDDEEQTTWMVWDEKLEKCVPEGDVFGLAQMPPDSFKVTKHDGKKIGIVKYANGAVQYTIDQEHFYSDFETAVAESISPSVTTTVVDFVKSKWKWMFNNKENTADTKIIEKISDRMFDDLVSTTKKTVAQLGSGMATGMGASTVVAGPATMGLSLPAASVAIIGKAGPPEELKMDIKRYITQREDTFSNSKEEARTHIEDVGAQPQTEGMFGNDKDAMYGAFESAYKRYCVIQKMKGGKCRNN